IPGKFPLSSYPLHLLLHAAPTICFCCRRPSLITPRCMGRTKITVPFLCFSTQKLLPLYIVDDISMPWVSTAIRSAYTDLIQCISNIQKFRRCFYTKKHGSLETSVLHAN